VSVLPVDSKNLFVSPATPIGARELDSFFAPVVSLDSLALEFWTANDCDVAGSNWGDANVRAAIYTAIAAAACRVSSLGGSRMFIFADDSTIIMNRHGLAL